MSDLKTMKLVQFSGDASEWRDWRSVFESYLRKTSREEYNILKETTTARNEEKELKFSKDDQTALVSLFDTLNITCRGAASATIRALSKNDTDKGSKAWVALLEKYEVNTRTRFVSVHHSLLEAKLDIRDPDKYFHEVDQLRKQLQDLSSEKRLIPDDEMISFALYALPKEIDYLRSILEADKKLTYEALKIHVRSHTESKKMTTSKTGEEEAHAVMKKNKFKGSCHKCGVFGHRADQCMKKGKEKPGQRQVCGNCGMRNHATKDCFRPGGPRHYANVVKEDESSDEECAFTASSTTECQSDAWAVDSACTSHITNELSEDEDIEEIPLQNESENKEEPRLDDKPSHRSERLRQIPRVDYVPQIFRQPRNRKLECADGAVACVTVDSYDDPKTYNQAVNGKDAEEWQSAMQKEYQSLVENNTWKLTPLPEGKNLISSKWVFKRKRNADGSVAKFKARFVARGFSQVEGVDYFETFAPVARFTSIRATIALAAQKGWKIYQMDVDNAFLNAPVEEEIYVEQPKGMEVQSPNEEKLVLKLLRALYGSKQGSRNWNSVLHHFLISHGMTQSTADPCVYTKSNQRHQLTIVTVYVDDLIITGDDEQGIRSLKNALNGRFKMKDLGELRWCLGIEVNRTDTGIEINQKQYLCSILQRFGMDQSKPVSTPADPNTKLTKNDCPQNPTEENKMRAIPYRSAVGSLLYAAVATRPDISTAVRDVARFVSCPGEQHWVAVKRIFRYLQGTLETKIRFSGGSATTVLSGYSDSDWGSNTDDRRSNTGYVFMMANAAISWQSKAQPTVALSSSEAEYMALCSAAQEAIYLRRLFADLGSPQDDPTMIYQDNQGCIAMAHNPVHHSRTKHIDIKFHFVRERIAAGEIKLEYIPTENQVADILTKGLHGPKFTKFKEAMLGQSQG
jgi:hypothetical protein